MFQSIQVDQVFDATRAMSSESDPAYWLAQLRKADWRYLLKFVDVKLPAKTKKQILVETALGNFEFVTCDGCGDVWRLWNEMRNEHRILVIQFRHSESDWSRGIPEFVHLEKNDPLGFVNIAGRLQEYLRRSVPTN
ncbi:MAG: hypothetical protein IPJ46_11515 [Anaerolineales bacterium]|nr:hypothetical protein [Anaerolineales bacterium]